jgi:hypothetical protein
MEEKDKDVLGHVDSVTEDEEGVKMEGTLNDEGLSVMRDYAAKDAEWSTRLFNSGVTYLPPDKPGPDGDFYKGLFWGILISIPMWALIIFVFVLLVRVVT